LKIYNFGPDINLIDLQLPGAEGFLGSYVIKSDLIALVDIGPASSVNALLAGLTELKIKPHEVNYILSTHIHLDHMGGLGQALKSMPNAQVIVHEKGLRHLANPEKLWQGSLATLGIIAQAYGQPEPAASNRLIQAEDGMIIDLGNKQIEVFLTPGHAPHHLSFYDRKRGRLFSGEAAGVYFPETGILRPASPPPFDLKQTLESVDKLSALQPQEIYYAHFGYSGKAMQLLQHYKEKVIFWGKTIVKFPDVDEQTVVEAVIKADQSQAPIFSFTPEQLKTEIQFITNNIRGYRDYFKREGTEILKEFIS